MKKLIFSGVAALMLVATGCKGGSQANDDLAAQKDSLTVAVANAFAAEIGQQLNQMPDSIRFDKAELLKGVKVVMAADTTKKGRSYLNGVQFGMYVMQAVQNIEMQVGTSIDKAKLVDALKLALAPDSIAVDPQTAYNNMMTAIMKTKEIKMANDPEVIANKKATEGFLNEMKKKENVKSLENGVVYEVIKEGEGKKVNASDMVYAIYEMTAKDGTQLSSSQGKAIQLPASSFGNVNPAMAEAVTAMQEGGHYKFYVNVGVAVPQGGQLKPYDVIVFDIELTTAEKAAEQK